MCYSPSFWLLFVLLIVQILVLSALADEASYGEDGLGLSHSQGRLCPSYFFQAFGGYASAWSLMDSQRWLTPRLDLDFSLLVMLDVNQIQGFKIWDPGQFWMLDFSGSSAMMFQVGDFITGGALLKLNLGQIWLFDLGLFNLLSKNKYEQLCKFRLWFYFFFFIGSP